MKSCPFLENATIRFHVADLTYRPVYEDLDLDVHARVFDLMVAF